MKRKIAAFLLVIAIVLTQTGLVYARGFSGGGRSFGGSSFSRSSSSFSSYKSSSSGWGSSSSSKSYSSWGSSGSSKSYGGWSGSSSSSKSSSGWGSSYSSSGAGSSKSYGGWSNSSSSSGSSRGVPNSYSGTGSAFYNSSRTGTSKSSYMQSAYNKQASAGNFTAYKQNLNAEQQRVYNSSMNRNYSVGTRTNYNNAMNTRAQRISYYDTAPVRVRVNNYYFGGPLSYGSGFVGIWDLWFLMRASDLFWYHHWDDIYPYRSYFDSSDFTAREAAMRTMQAQGIARNSSYLDPNVNPDLQFSQAYVNSHPGSVYTGYKKPSSHPFLTFIVILIFAGMLIFVLKYLLKKPINPRYSSIY